jgi:hypothetical protein
VPRTYLILAAIAAGIYFALCLVLFLAQRSFIYFPQPKSASSDKKLDLNVDGERTGADGVSHNTVSESPEYIPLLRKTP